MPPAQLSVLFCISVVGPQKLLVELNTAMSLRAFMVGCFCVLLFFLKDKTAENCKNRFISK